LENNVFTGITILGLGPGNAGWLTREAEDALSKAKEIYLRTTHHPSVSAILASTKMHSFDALYQKSADFENNCHTIMKTIVELGARPQGVLYAVPGDPLIGDATVLSIRRKAIELAIPVRIISGMSFIEPCLAALGIDVLDGLHVIDALCIVGGHSPSFSPDTPVLIGHLYSKDIAAGVKLNLMNQYPGEHPVSMLHFAGLDQPTVEKFSLVEIDRNSKIDPAAVLFVPPLLVASSFEAFQETIACLRAPGGCPWDRKQTHQTLRSNLLEEAYEVLQALDEDDPKALKEELGDLLLQIVLHAQIATDADEFRMADVVAGINTKIIRRHPHVFGDIVIDGTDDVLHLWEALKAEEREREGNHEGLLHGVPRTLPALSQANEIQDRVVRVGFDWPKIDGVLDKIAEELGEVQQAEDQEKRAAEMGDLLFAVVNYARWINVNPEAALRAANKRFQRRFSCLEKAAHNAGQSVNDMTIEEMDQLWEAAKREENG
jgi:tetrapyrrole methylase family protein/MazG family protein